MGNPRIKLSVKTQLILESFKYASEKSRVPYFWDEEAEINGKLDVCKSTMLVENDQGLFDPNTFNEERIKEINLVIQNIIHTEIIPKDAKALSKAVFGEEVFWPLLVQSIVADSIIWSPVVD